MFNRLIILFIKSGKIDWKVWFQRMYRRYCCCCCCCCQWRHWWWWWCRVTTGWARHSRGLFRVSQLCCCHSRNVQWFAIRTRQNLRGGLPTLSGFGALIDLSFSVSMMFGRREGNPACKTAEWWGVGIVICLERGADLHMVQLMPLPLTACCFSKSRLFLPFWYLHTWVVSDEGPLNGCRCCCFGLCRRA